MSAQTSGRSRPVTREQAETSPRSRAEDVPRQGKSSRKSASQASPARRPGFRLKDSASVWYHLVWVSALMLLVGGLCMMLSVSAAGAVSGGGSFVYIRQQGVTAAIGIAALLILSRVDYRRLRTVSIVLLAIALGSLLLIHIPGVAHTAGGSASFWRLGSVTFQPSEFAKVALVLAGAHLLSTRRLRTNAFASFMWPFGALGLGMCVMVVLEPDLGTAIILAGLVLGLLWVAGMKGRHWLLVAGTGLVCAVGFTLASPEKMSRILSFIDPSSDPHGASFQLNQSLVALGRGGWFGVGPGGSVQKFDYLPKAHTDMIYAIVGEEFGLLGAGLIIVLFAVFALACWQLARRCVDPMGRYLIAGCGMLVTLQAVVNIGGVTGALPLTGVPLPFISYGRNSLLVMLVAVGLILSVSRFASPRPARIRTEAYDNVAHLDRRRRHGGPRGAGSGAG